MNCEACGTDKRVSEWPTPDNLPLVVCDSCAHRIKMLSLRPREWFRLAALHGRRSFLLHDDFYDDNGVADQPQEPVEAPEKHPFPTLSECAGSLQLALDVAYVKWRFPEDLIGVLSAKPLETLALIQSTTAKRKREEIRGRALEVAALCVGPLAGDWVRAQWAEAPETALCEISQASFACLPVGEGLSRVVAALQSEPDKLSDRISVLSCFKDESALDAIETLIRSPVVTSWGRTAAACGLSWSRTLRWLEHGRPLSLVALDALVATVDYDTPLLREREPHLIGPVDHETFRQALSRYAIKDSEPRTKKTVEKLFALADQIVAQQISSSGQ